MTRRGRAGAAFSLFAFQDIITSVTGIMILVTLILALELIQRKESSPVAKTAEVVAELQQALEQNTQTIEGLERVYNDRQREIDTLAGFDVNRVRAEMRDMLEFNQELSEDIERLSQETRAAQERQADARELQAEHASDAQSLEELRNRIRQAREQLEELRTSNRRVYNPTPGDAKKPWLLQLDGNSIQAAEVGRSAPPTRLASAADLTQWLRKRDRSSEYFVLLVKPAGVGEFLNIMDIVQKQGFEVGYDLLQADENALDPETGAAAK